MKYLLLLYFHWSFISFGQSIDNPSQSGIEEYELEKWIISGDFDGDGKEEELRETLTSKVDGSSMDSLPFVDYDSLVAIVYTVLPITTLISNNENIPDLLVTSDASLGLCWLKNEGDLNGDGTDEISLVIDWADWSQVNRCIVYTLKENQWIQYAKFEIREWKISQDIDFDGFITKNKENKFEVATFDLEMNETVKLLNEVLVTNP